MNSIRRTWRSSSKVAKVVMVLAAIGIVGSACNALSGNSMSDGFNAGRQAAGTPATTSPTPPTTKNLAERVFTAQYVGMTESNDGRILVAFEALKMTRENVEGDIKRFMRQLTSERKDGWTSVAVSAYGTTTDSATGKSEKKPVYTVSFSREQAMAVVDWDRVNVVTAGLREHAIPQLMD